MSLADPRDRRTGDGLRSRTLMTTRGHRLALRSGRPVDAASVAPPAELAQAAHSQVTGGGSPPPASTSAARSSGLAPDHGRLHRDSSSSPALHLIGARPRPLDRRRASDFPLMFGTIRFLHFRVPASRSRSGFLFRIGFTPSWVGRSLREIFLPRVDRKRFRRDLAAGAQVVRLPPQRAEPSRRPTIPLAQLIILVFFHAARDVRDRHPASRSTRKGSVGGSALDRLFGWVGPMLGGNTAAPRSTT